MPHIILDVNFPTHPKVLRVAPLAQLLHIRAMLYSCQHLTDGKLHRSIVGMLGYDLGDAQALARELIEARLWHERGDEIEINDYLEYQFSKREIEARRRQKREAGQAGGQASAQARAQADAQADAQAGGQASAQADAQAGARASGSPMDGQTPKRKATPISDIRCPISDVRSPMTDVGRKKKTCSGDAAAPAKSEATFRAYAQGYHARYRVMPVRNASVNAMLCRLVDKLGGEEAPQVAAFYVTHGDLLYVRRRHPVELLLKDAEGLRTQWATGSTGEPVRPKTVAEML